MQPRAAGPTLAVVSIKRCTLRFYGDLSDLAWDADRAGEVQVTVEAPRSVKDAIETCGVPHTEVDLVVVNGRSVGFDHLCGDGDRVAVYPPFMSLDVVSHVRPPAPPEAAFVLDVHLGRLAERMRLLGFDVRYRNDFADDELVDVALAERRWLLTRDRGVLMRRAVTHGYLVRNTNPLEQTVEVLRRFGLGGSLQPFTRCPRCNGLLEVVAKDAIADRLEPGTRADYDEFARCRSCGQLYWEGAHHGSLREFVAAVQARA